MLTPRDRIVAGGDINNAMRMLDDFSGMPMTPTQVGSVRKTIGEGRTAMKEGKPDYNQRRVARQMLDEFDAWAEPALPNIGEARATAQRAILGREIQDANDQAAVKAAQYTQSGEENALRTVYRGMDMNDVRGRNSYPEELSSAIQNVARGNPWSNAMRALGKFDPTTGAISALPTLGAGSLGATMLGPMAGAATGVALGGAGMFGKRAATRMTQRAAQEAELTALGGPEYQTLLDQAREVARERAKGLGVAFTVPAASAATR